ncbi:hypothetical protein TD95_002109 [Thielaviopsis punctulata]|uniref:ATP-grasp domain-containing protein n=1 Tax=Thielaviopsis punctulata TaxID=72032 RepID=A0A0F4ZAB0_9PEZI|nr:hypothetical protein TD95_002109 [Thielaviopsis punctulata]
MPSYKSTKLFGGAIVADLPTNYIDVSTLRSVPDHQEVFIDKDGFSSIVIEINERIGGPGSSPEIDGLALTEHLMDVVGEDRKDCVQVWSSTETNFSRIDAKYPAYTLIATDTPTDNNDGKAPDFTALVMSLVRLEEKSTDILITINVPHIKGEYDEDEIDLELGKQGSQIGEAIEFASTIWQTFEIKDFGLFN